MRLRAWFGGALLLIAMPAGGGEKLTMRVSPSTTYEPATVMMVVYVEPDADNRAILVVAESADFYRSSEVELAGDRAPRTNVFRYASLPAGDYDVHGILLGSGREARAMVRSRVSVIPIGGR